MFPLKVCENLPFLESTIKKILQFWFLSSSSFSSMINWVLSQARHFYRQLIFFIKKNQIVMLNIFLASVWKELKAWAVELINGRVAFLSQFGFSGRQTLRWRFQSMEKGRKHDWAKGEVGPWCSLNKSLSPRRGELGSPVQYLPWVGQSWGPLYSCVNQLDKGCAGGGSETLDKAVLFSQCSSRRRLTAAPDCCHSWTLESECRIPNGSWLQAAAATYCSLSCGWLVGANALFRFVCLSFLQVQNPFKCRICLHSNHRPLCFHSCCFSCFLLCQILCLQLLSFHLKKLSFREPSVTSPALSNLPWQSLAS